MAADRRVVYAQRHCPFARWKAGGGGHGKTRHLQLSLLQFLSLNARSLYRVEWRGKATNPASRITDALSVGTFASNIIERLLATVRLASDKTEALREEIDGLPKPHGERAGTGTSCLLES